MAVRYLRVLPRRQRELRLRVRQLASALIVVALVAGFGAFTYNSGWLKDSRLTGTLAALQLFPDQLQNYYSQHSKRVGPAGSEAARDWDALASRGSNGGQRGGGSAVRGRSS